MDITLDSRAYGRDAHVTISAMQVRDPTTAEFDLRAALAMEAESTGRYIDIQEVETVDETLSAELHINGSTPCGAEQTVKNAMVFFQSKQS